MGKLPLHTGYQSSQLVGARDGDGVWVPCGGGLGKHQCRGLSAHLLHVFCRRTTSNSPAPTCKPSLSGECPCGNGPGALPDHPALPSWGWGRADPVQPSVALPVLSSPLLSQACSSHVAASWSQDLGYPESHPPEPPSSPHAPSPAKTMHHEPTVSTSTPSQPGPHPSQGPVWPPRCVPLLMQPLPCSALGMDPGCLCPRPRHCLTLGPITPWHSPGSCSPGCECTLLCPSLDVAWHWRRPPRSVPGFACAQTLAVLPQRGWKVSY